MSAQELKKALRKLASEKKASASAWFFKTGPGQYGEGDKFIGVTVPEQRKLAREFKDLDLVEIESLLQSPFHEERLVSLFILVNRFKGSSQRTQKEIFDFYLANTKSINNWDLVDSSASYIVGEYLLDKPRRVLYSLARSKNLWERRIAVIATFSFIVRGESKDSLKITELLLGDKEDLMHKAVGWMLREVGKRVSREVLIKFLRVHYSTLSRTSLRYAIEHFPAETRQKYLKGKF
ncbi:MAG: DNA alkylation repair protein [bacterium]|nr:DNA alkylation repair protein [bacterium]